MADKNLQKIRDRLEAGVVPAELTATQAAVLTYVLQCWMSGFLPTYRELCSQFGWSSPNAAVSHTRALERKGYLESEDSKSGLILSDKSLTLALKSK
jgi:hypothetical protein